MDHRFERSKLLASRGVENAQLDRPGLHFHPRRQSRLPGFEEPAAINDAAGIEFRHGGLTGGVKLTIRFKDALAADHLHQQIINDLGTNLTVVAENL